MRLPIEERKSRTSTHYKYLTRYTTRGPDPLSDLPRHLALDVDSLVFLWMRTGISPSSTQGYATQLGVLLDTLTRDRGVDALCVASTGIPPLKRPLYQERKERGDPYHHRDTLRDRTVQGFLQDPRRREKMVLVEEADQYCGRNFRYILTEDVDVFLFGDEETTLIHPLDFRCLRCRDYLSQLGIPTHPLFLQAALILGTDYNNGIRGCGPKTLVKALRRGETPGEYLERRHDLFHEKSLQYLEEVFYPCLEYFTQTPKKKRKEEE
jgi:hypothetical protein